MDEHTPGLKRLRTDDELRKWSVEGLYDLAAACEVEPADATICDACAAYLIAQEKETDEGVIPENGNIIENLMAQRDEWMARALVAEAAVAELMEEKNQ